VRRVRVTLERALESRMRLLPQRLDAGLARDNVQRSGRRPQPADVRRQLHFAYLNTKIRRTGHGKRERHVTGSARRFVFLAMFAKKRLQILR